MLGLFQRCAFWNGDQIVFGHQGADFLVEVFLKPEVPVGQNSHQFFLLRNGDAGDAVFSHDAQSFTDLLVGTHGDRVGDHGTHRTFDLVDHFALSFRWKTAMDDADSTFLSQGNGQICLGNRVHGGTD